MSAAIQISDVSKSFGKVEVLKNVSFEVPKGVVFALLGENGAGKSTLIRGLLGFHRFKSGSVRVCGHDPAKQALQLRRLVGYVADSPGLYDWMTVAEAGWFASGFYADGFLTKYDEFCNEFSVPADAKISDLSKGMRAKVALSLAMAFEPELLVLDEPTSGLDPVVRRSFLESMIDRAASGQTVFLSSHQIHEVERVADYVAILHQGELKVVSSLEELKNSVQLLSYSERDTLLAPPNELQSLKSLSSRKDGRTTQMLVSGLTNEILHKLQEHGNLFEVQAIRPNLEELYIAFTSGNAASFIRDVEQRPARDLDVA